MKLAAGFAVLFTASTQGFATAGETASASNLAFIQLPGFQSEKPQAAPFEFRNLTLPHEFLFQGTTSIPVEWWQQGSGSPLAIVIGNAEGTRQLDGSMRPAYYWHRDPGNGANNFGSFSFQHLSSQETATVLDQANSDEKRLAAANQALPEMADQRQLVKLRRFHDLLQAQAKRHGMELTNLELINGLDLTTQSELAGLDAWGYVDRLAQMKKTVADPDEQIIRARTWSYWDPVKNRWAAPGLGNTEYYIRRDQARRFDAVKQALLYQAQQPSLLQEIDLAEIGGRASNSPTATPISLSPDSTEDRWAIALINQAAPLEGSSFNRQPLQFETAHNDLDAVFAETMAAEAVLADAIAQNAAAAMANPEDIGLADVDVKGELSRVTAQASLEQSEANAIAAALGGNRSQALAAEPSWQRLAMTPEEFALATAVASPSLDIEASASLATTTEALEAETIATALEASVIATSVETASAIATFRAPSRPLSLQAESGDPSASSSLPIANSAKGLAQTSTSAPTEERLDETDSTSAGVDNSAELETNAELSGDINSSLLTVQPFIPAALQALPLEAAPVEPPTATAVKPGQSFKHTPKMAQLAALAHVQAAEPLINDRLESKEFLNLASGLKESPIDISDESLGLATASEAVMPESGSLNNEDPTAASNAAASSPATIHFSPEAIALDPEKDPWIVPEAAVKIEAPPVEPIIPADVQAILAQPPQPSEIAQNISETVVFFEENISQ